MGAAADVRTPHCGRRDEVMMAIEAESSTMEVETI